MRLKIETAIILLLMLTGCAGSATTPTLVQQLPSAQTSPTRINNITADADPGVLIGDNDYADIIGLIKTDLQSQPDVLLVNDTSGDTMHIHFTRFERGNAFARLMLAGLGQIHIDATIYITSSLGEQLGEYRISKDFFLGGAYGATTTIEDVEVGFAKSVAAIFTTSG